MLDIAGATGAMTPENVAAAKKLNDKQSADNQRQIEQDKNGAIGGAEKDRDAKIRSAQDELNRTLDALATANQNDNAALKGASDKEVTALQQKVADLKKQLDQLAGKAAGEKKPDWGLPAMPDFKGGGDQGDDGDGVPLGAGTGKGGHGETIFGGDAGYGLGGGTAADRTAVATEQTAKNTADLLNKPPTAGPASSSVPGLGTTSLFGLPTWTPNPADVTDEHGRMIARKGEIPNPAGSGLLPIDADDDIRKWTVYENMKRKGSNIAEPPQSSLTTGDRGTRQYFAEHPDRHQDEADYYARLENAKKKQLEEAGRGNFLTDMFKKLDLTGITNLLPSSGGLSIPNAGATGAKSSDPKSATNTGKGSSPDVVSELKITNTLLSKLVGNAGKGLKFS